MPEASRLPVIRAQLTSPTRVGVGVPPAWLPQSTIIGLWFNNGMARPQKYSDELLLAAAATVISRLGPAFTLADVAEEAQVVVGTVAHRFGSKHGLLVAMMEAAIESLRREIRAAVADAADPVAAVKRGLLEHYARLGTPGAAANNLAQLGVDLADDDLRDGLSRLYAVMEAELHPPLARAAAAGELSGAPSTPVAARILTALADGASMHWSARPQGELVNRLDADLEAVLAGWRRPPMTNASVSTG